MLVQLMAGQTEFSFYLAWCAIAAAGYCLRVLFANWSTSVSHQATYAVLRNMRKAMVSKLSRLPMGTLLDTPSGQHLGIIVDRVESLETPLAHLLPEMT
ncbi:MAG: ABC transporter ATP-binding protein, partial [Oscillospiraceae bacterium]